MSEIFDTYMQQVYPTCWDCPLLRACVEAEISAQRSVDGNIDALQNLLERPVGDIPEVDEFLRASHGMLLDINTKLELDATRMISRLNDNKELCPGTKRGAPDPYPRSWKVVAYLMNERSCRNPALRELFRD